MRSAIGKRRRFRILQKSKFRCAYCGARPQDGARLVLDHVVAVANGGTDDDSNLVAACVPCNQGKGDLGRGDGQGCPFCFSVACPAVIDGEGERCPEIAKLIAGGREMRHQ